MIEKLKVRATIVIPTYNNHSFLKERLSFYESIALKEDREVIIIDDGFDMPFSLKKDSAIKLYRSEHNKGVSHARNQGIQIARYPIVIFIDDDVVVDEDILEIAIKRFHLSSASAFSCMHSKFYVSDNFPTRYKSKYMHATFKKTAEPAQFIYGSLCGLKKESLVTWQEGLAYGEDTYLATSLINKGLLIDFYSDLEFDHHKRYTWVSLIKNDFLIPFFFVKSFLLQKNKKKRFSHTNPNQLMAIACIPFFPIFPLAFLFWMYFNRDLFQEISEENPVALTLFTLLDQFTMGLGIFCGFTYSLLNSGRYLDLDD